MEFFRDSLRGGGLLSFSALLADASFSTGDTEAVVSGAGSAVVGSLPPGSDSRLFFLFVGLVDSNVPAPSGISIIRENPRSEVDLRFVSL